MYPMSYYGDKIPEGAEDKMIEAERTAERWYDTAGHVMCCVCFEQVPVNDVFVCEHGQKWDMCQQDGQREGCVGCTRQVEEQEGISEPPC